MSKVVSLYGSTVIYDTTPNKDVVETLRDLLQRAESGNINGIAVAVHLSDETSMQYFNGTHSYSIIGRLHSLQDRILELLRS